MWLVVLIATAHADDDALYRALSVRDPAPSCEHLASLADDPAAAFLRMAETVELPPWVPMRAARCLVAHHGEAAADAFERWVATPEQAGLGQLVLRRTTTLPEPVAARVVARALDGTLRTDAEQAIAQDVRPAVQALRATAAPTE